MSTNNVVKKKTSNSKEKKMGNKRPSNKSPFKKDKAAFNLKMERNDLNMTLPNKEINFLESSTNNFIHDITEGKGKKLQNSQNAYLSKLNNMNSYGFNDNSYMFQMNNRGISSLTSSNLLDNSSSSLKPTNRHNQKIMKINSMQNVKSPNTIKNISLNNNIKKNVITSNKSNTILNDNMPSFNTEPFDSKYSFKINKIKDDYIDFLQKEFEDHTKKSVKLDSNNKELLKKCDDLIHDNLILSNTLNDRTAKLNKIIQENLIVKSELDKCLLNNQKNEQKLEFYEEQFNLFKTSNDNYQKIIKELKEENERLNKNLIEMQKNNEQDLKKTELTFKTHLKEEIENTKKGLEEFYNNKSLEQNEKNEKKTQSYMEQIKELQDKNNELSSELKNKEKMLDIACKENEKLTTENNLFRTQVDQYSHQVGELNTIIKHKDNIINNLKLENLNNEKFLNKSSSVSMVKFDGSEYLNENISKLITDNEENKMKIEILNDKIKSIDEIERKYNEIMNGNRTLTLSEKLAMHINTNSPKNVSTHFNYNTINDSKNNTYQKSNRNATNKSYNKMISPRRLQLQKEFGDMISPIISRSKYDKNEFNKLNKDLTSKNKNNGNNVVVYSSNITKDNKKRSDKNNGGKEKNKLNVDREIKVTKKGNKGPEKEKKDNNNINRTVNKTRKAEITTPIKGRYYRKNEDDILNSNIDERTKRITQGKEYDLQKDDSNRKKNFTHRPKNLNYSLEDIEYEQRNGDKILSLARINTDRDEEEKPNKLETIYYLYGIDRNDVLHVFDINNKRWADMKKISDLDDKSDTFKKDYQYEGTLLYNTLSGVYILTGEKTDTLYYLNSKTNVITKICKFNNCHDNGSIMYDTKNNCLYVFGGKKITSCEYYSFSDKKVYKLPDLTVDRANASFIISNNKIYGFFGFSYGKNGYTKTIEYMDYTKKDKWVELKNIEFLKKDISFDTESVSTMYYKQNPNKILIYCGIQGEDEDFVTEYYLLYDARNNSMDKINKWNIQQYKSMGNRWKNYNLKKNDPKGFHFAKNSRFILLPKGSYEGYNERDPIDVMIDYKNNVHYILQEKQKIDIYRSDI